MKNLGAKIKSLRVAKGLTIVQVAKTTGIDQATLSRIENGKMTGTLDSHMKIAEALGIRLPQLYENIAGEAGSREETAKRRLENYSFSTGAVAELLTGGIFNKKMMPALLKIKPRGHTQTEEFKTGTERFIFITQGNVELVVGNESKPLAQNQSLYFDASLPHHFSNRTKTPAEVLSVLTPVSL